MSLLYSTLNKVADSKFEVRGKFSGEEMLERLVVKRIWNVGESVIGHEL
jgi:hypothetical protein